MALDACMLVCLGFIHTLEMSSWFCLFGCFGCVDFIYPLEIVKLQHEQRGKMGTKLCLFAMRTYKEAGLRDGTGRSAWFGWYCVLVRWNVSFIFTAVCPPRSRSRKWGHNADPGS